ncbi:MAG: polysaccharide deacetylase family protein [Thermoproteota archaeon]|nr:polysaccharide deacetylase family protein [Thermoproteota archaeon]
MGPKLWRFKLVAIVLGINIFILLLIFFPVPMQDSNGASIPEERSLGLPFDFSLGTSDNDLPLMVKGDSSSDPLDTKQPDNENKEERSPKANEDATTNTSPQRTIEDDPDYDHSKYNRYNDFITYNDKTPSDPAIKNEIEKPLVEDKSNSANDDKHSPKIDDGLSEKQAEPTIDNDPVDNSENAHDSTKDEIPEIESADKDNIAIVTFDDNWKSQYENAVPILDEFGFKATFYIVCDYIGNKDRMGWENIAKLYEQGHEIGSHSMTHENLDIATGASLEREMVQSKKCIEENGIKVKGFSYPFNSGDDDPSVLDLVSSNYEYARTAGGAPGGVDVSKIMEDDSGQEKYRIVGWSHDAEKKNNAYTDMQMLDLFKEYVSVPADEESKAENIPIIIYHKIDDSGEDYSTSIDLFRAEMAYLYENGYKVVTMEQMFS